MGNELQTLLGRVYKKACLVSIWMTPNIIGLISIHHTDLLIGAENLNILFKQYHMLYRKGLADCGEKSTV